MSCADTNQRSSSSSVDCAGPDAKPLSYEIIGRVFRKRNLVAVHFFDCITVDDNGRSEVVELVIPTDISTPAKDVHVGDVVSVTEGTIEWELAKPPRSCIVRVSDFKIVEPWSFHLGKGGLHFQQIVFHDDIKCISLSDRSQERCGGIPDVVNGGLLKGCVPRAILQCPEPLADRVAKYFNGVKLSHFWKDRLVMLYEDHQEEPPYFKVRRQKFLIDEVIEEFLCAVVQRVYFIQPDLKAVSHAQVVDKYTKALSSNNPDQNFARARLLRCYPRSLENTIKDMFVRTSSDGGKPTSGLSSGCCDCIVYADGLYWLGLDVKRMIVPDKSLKVVPSSAYYKLLEIRERYLKQSLNVMELYDNRFLAIDIGASPGGWSYCLAESFKTKLTLAVDPAAYMHPVLESFYSTANEAQKSQILHWVCRGEEGLEKLQVRVSEDGIKASVFVCDMNTDLETSVDMLKKFIEKELFERPCLAVVTFKMTCRGKKEFADRKSSAWKVLQTDCGLSDLQELHLFANTALETTVVGQLL